MRTLSTAVLLVLPFALACGGSAPPDLTAPHSISSSGMSFQMPGNWTVEEESDVIEGIRLHTFIIETPNEGLIGINSFDREVDMTAAGFADQLLINTPAEIKALVGDTFTFTEGASGQNQRALVGQPITTELRAFTMAGLGMDLPHTIEVGTVLTAGHHIVVYSQVSDEDLAMDQPGFDLVWQSLNVE